MSKKDLYKLGKNNLKGFEDFVINSEDLNLPFTNSSSKSPKEINHKGISLLENDNARLVKIKELIKHKLPMSSQYSQSLQIIREQKTLLQNLREEIFEFSEQENSPYKKSLSEIFDSFFNKD